MLCSAQLASVAALAVLEDMSRPQAVETEGSCLDMLPPLLYVHVQKLLTGKHKMK